MVLVPDLDQGVHEANLSLAGPRESVVGAHWRRQMPQKREAFANPA